jgi:integrase
MAKVRKRTWTSGGKEKTAWVADYFDQHIDADHPRGHRHIKTFELRRQAEEWLAGAQVEVKKGTHTPDSTSITVAQAADLWLKRGSLDNWRYSTLRNMEQQVKHLILPTSIADVKLSQVNRQKIDEFYYALLGTAGQPTPGNYRYRTKAVARRGLLCLKMIMAFAYRSELVARDVAQPNTTPRRDRKKLEIGVDIPSKNEIKLLINTPYLDRMPGRAPELGLAKYNRFWRAVFVTLAFTGMRQGEARGLTWDDVDFKGRCINVRRNVDRWHNTTEPKTPAGYRKIPMFPIVYQTLWDFANDSDGTVVMLRPGNNLVFDPTDPTLLMHRPRAIGLHLGGSSIMEALRRIQRKTGILNARGRFKYSGHDFRHFFASLIIEQGFTVKQATEIMGHSSVQMTFDLYGHLFPGDEEDQKKLAAAEASVLGTATGYDKP